MNNSQKLYDSTTISNKINKEKSILYHKKNLVEIKRKKSRINPEDEPSSPLRKKSQLSNQQLGKKL